MQMDVFFLVKGYLKLMSAVCIAFFNTWLLFYSITFLPIELGTHLRQFTRSRTKLNQSFLGLVWFYNATHLFDTHMCVAYTHLTTNPAVLVYIRHSPMWMTLWCLRSRVQIAVNAENRSSIIPPAIRKLWMITMLSIPLLYQYLSYLMSIIHLLSIILLISEFFYPYLSIIPSAIAINNPSNNPLVMIWIITSHSGWKRNSSAA